MLVLSYSGPQARLLGYDVALEIERDLGGRAAFAGRAAPDPVFVLHQAGHVAEACRLDARFCLPLGKAVGAGDRGAGVRG